PPTAKSFSIPLSLHDALPISMRAFGDLMLTHIETVKTHLPQVQTEYQQRVAQRLQEALEQASPEGTQYISPEEFSARIAQEAARSEEHTSELQSRFDLVCRLL